MIKLRFYNLEEQAEILEENGLLDEEDVMDFVVVAELKKQEFNSVRTKEEMRKIIEDVRGAWKELMEKVE